MSQNRYEAQKEALMQEVRSVLAELEKLQESAQDNASQEIQDFKTSLQEQIERAKAKLADLEKHAGEQVRQAAQQTDELVHEKPYYAMGIAALAGVVLGALLTRR